MMDIALPKSLHAMSNRRFTIALLAILLIGLAMRIGWAVSRDGTSLDALPDQLEYLQAGDALRERGELAFVDPRFGSLVYAFRMPGYPMVVAAMDGNARWIRIAQSLIDTLTAVAAAMLAFRISNSCICGLLAALFVVLNPFLIYFSGLILTETISASLITWGVLLLFIGSPPTRAQSSWKACVIWWLGILLLVMSIYFRPSLIGLPVLLAVSSCALVEYHSPTTRRRIPVAFLAGVLTLAFLFPWALRNRAVTGEWIWTTTNSGFTWYDGYNPAATGQSDQRFTQAMPELRIMNESVRSSYLQSKARDWAIENPLRSIELAGIKLARTFSPIPLSDQFGSNKLHVAAAIVFSVPIFTLAVMGLWSSRVSRGTKLMLAMPVLYIAMVHTLTVGSLRYRVPIEPIIGVLAGMGAAALIRRESADGDDFGEVDEQDELRISNQT